MSIDIHSTADLSFFIVVVDFVAEGRLRMKRYLLSAWLVVALAPIQIFGVTASAAEDLGEKLVRKFFSDVKSGNLVMSPDHCEVIGYTRISLIGQI